MGCCCFGHGLLLLRAWAAAASGMGCFCFGHGLLLLRAWAAASSGMRCCCFGHGLLLLRAFAADACHGCVKDRSVTKDPVTTRPMVPVTSHGPGHVPWTRSRPTDPVTSHGPGHLAHCRVPHIRFLGTNCLRICSGSADSSALSWSLTLPIKEQKR
jgi:hypothetical protein